MLGDQRKLRKQKRRHKKWLCAEKQQCVSLLADIYLKRPPQEHTDSSLQFPSRIPIRENVDNTWEEARFENTQEESASNDATIVECESCAHRHYAESGHDEGNVMPRSNSLIEDLRWAVRYGNQYNHMSFVCQAEGC